MKSVSSFPGVQFIDWVGTWCEFGGCASFPTA